MTSPETRRVTVAWWPHRNRAATTRRSASLDDDVGDVTPARAGRVLRVRAARPAPPARVGRARGVAPGHDAPVAAAGAGAPRRVRGVVALAALGGVDREGR